MDNVKFDFLFMSLPRHDERYTSTPWQLAVEISMRHSVFFIDNPFTITEAFFNIRNKQIRKRIAAYFKQPVETKDGVIIIYPPFTLPLNFLPKGNLYNLILSYNQRIVARRLNLLFGKEGFKNLCYINSFNFYFPTLSNYFLVKPTLQVYHCIDPMVKSYTLKHGLYLQRNAAIQADMVITTASSLRNQFIGHQYPECYYVPNAANFTLFSKAQDRGLEIHPRVTFIKGKVMGYFGNIERRTDEELLLQVLDQLSDWNLIMAGPLEKAYFSIDFLNHPRIHFVGSFKHDEAPAVIKRFDVAIIPFKCDQVSAGIYPLKLYEYLAAGKPVITTNFNPELFIGINGEVNVATNSSEFADHIVNSQNDTQQDVVRRTKLAWDNSWEARTRQFEKVIYKHYHGTKTNNKKQPETKTIPVKNYF